MNAEDIAKALKCCYAPEGKGSCDGCPYSDDEGLCYGLNIEYHAGDIIESLLAQLERFNATLAREGFTELETMIAKYKTVILAANELSIETDEEIEALRGQLKESQRREQAAVEDIQISHTNMCAICKYEESAPEDGCVVNSNGNCDFVWRGPVED